MAVLDTLHVENLLAIKLAVKVFVVVWRYSGGMDEAELYNCPPKAAPNCYFHTIRSLINVLLCCLARTWLVLKYKLLGWRLRALD